MVPVCSSVSVNIYQLYNTVNVYNTEYFYMCVLWKPSISPAASVI